MRFLKICFQLLGGSPRFYFFNVSTFPLKCMLSTFQFLQRFYLFNVSTFPLKWVLSMIQILQRFHVCFRAEPLTFQRSQRFNVSNVGNLDFKNECICWNTSFYNHTRDACFGGDSKYSRFYPKVRLHALLPDRGECQR